MQRKNVKNKCRFWNALKFFLFINEQIYTIKYKFCKNFGT